MVNVVTEIRSFYSIKEMSETLEREIETYKSVGEEYSQWLGSFLRDSEIVNEEWTKTVGGLRKAKGKAKKGTKKSKSKKSSTSAEWIQFNDIMVSASELGEAEILFDAIENITRKIEQLEKVKDSIVKLEKSGLGKDIIYLVYNCDGVPEKIVLRHKKDKEFAEKFQYIADFSVLKVV